ncbi:MAG: DUF1385 domain-containing protein [Oscillospiraceae bacterium]|nr:DUF1385 domain-containing protein [Oscillospiraceae bacterium]
MKKTNNDVLSCRLGKVGGQAVLEGVMMKSGEDTCLAVRGEDGKVTTKSTKFVSLRKKYKIFNLPLIRGVVNFIEMMILSMNTLTASAEMLGIDEAEAETKFEKWLTEKLGDKLMSVVMGIAMVLAVFLSVGLFVFLPTKASEGLAYLTKIDSVVFRSVIEGILKMGIFVGYIALVALMPEIKRTFQYHGAEHKSVACYEKGLELTPENAATCTRFHPRCGTSFIIVMLILSIVISMFIPGRGSLLRSLLKILLIPVSVGVGFEFIMFAGKHDNAFTRALSAPGLWMQRLTTKEPDASQLEVAITALKGAIPAEFPPVETAEESTDEAANNEPVDAEAQDNA